MHIHCSKLLHISTLNLSLSTTPTTGYFNRLRASSLQNTLPDHLADFNFNKVKTFIWRVHSVDIISAYGSVLSPSSSSCSPADRKTVQQQSCFLLVLVVVVVVFCFLFFCCCCCFRGEKVHVQGSQQCFEVQVLRQVMGLFLAFRELCPLL